MAAMFTHESKFLLNACNKMEKRMINMLTVFILFLLLLLVLNQLHIERGV